MTHTLHRKGTLEILSNDFPMHAMPARGFNAEGCKPKLQGFLRVANKHNAVNTGKCRQGEISLEKLPVDAYSGSAAVVDLSAIKPNQGITAQHLLEQGKHIKHNDIVLLKTCWDKHYHPDTKDYWIQAPYLTDEAAYWLAEKNRA